MPVTLGILQTPPENPVANLRNAEYALVLLAKDGPTDKVSLCALCQHNGTQACPHAGTGKLGLCSNFALDERDPQQTERRYLECLGVRSAA